MAQEDDDNLDFDLDVEGEDFEDASVPFGANEENKNLDKLVSRFTFPFG